MGKRTFNVTSNDTLQLNAKNGVCVLTIGRFRGGWFRPRTVELTLSGTGIEL